MVTVRNLKDWANGQRMLNKVIIKIENRTIRPSVTMVSYLTGAYLKNTNDGFALVLESQIMSGEPIGTHGLGYLIGYIDEQMERGNISQDSLVVLESNNHTFTYPVGMKSPAFNISNSPNHELQVTGYISAEKSIPSFFN